MRSRVTEWFETKIGYEKTTEDGMPKRVKELYVVDALSFTEAEKRICEEMSSYISGAFEVVDIRKATYKEIFFSEDASADRWYKAKLQFITIDEKTEKEKRSHQRGDGRNNDRLRHSKYCRDSRYGRLRG